mmetsp:Transcript_19549/g.38859  ORF Transcript_19549/g.38859 Transcript_19549/m.38859 type:complete len:213 (+) Transcript_19549:90-728(+)
MSPWRPRTIPPSCCSFRAGPIRTRASSARIPAPSPSTSPPASNRPHKRAPSPRNSTTAPPTRPTSAPPARGRSGTATPPRSATGPCARRTGSRSSIRTATRATRRWYWTRSRDGRSGPPGPSRKGRSSTSRTPRRPSLSITTSGTSSTASSRCTPTRSCTRSCATSSWPTAIRRPPPRGRGGPCRSRTSTPSSTTGARKRRRTGRISPATTK